VLCSSTEAADLTFQVLAWSLLCLWKKKKLSEFVCSINSECFWLALGDVQLWVSCGSGGLGDVQLWVSCGSVMCNFEIC
jgi:hypothetical protein